MEFNYGLERKRFDGEWDRGRKSYRDTFLDGGFSVSEAAQQTFFPQLQLPQQVIDEALCMGFNDRDSRKIICAYFMKDKPDNASFLQRS